MYDRETKRWNQSDTDWRFSVLNNGGEPCHLFDFIYALCLQDRCRTLHYGHKKKRLNGWSRSLHLIEAKWDIQWMSNKWETFSFFLHCSSTAIMCWFSYVHDFHIPCIFSTWGYEFLYYRIKSKQKSTNKEIYFVEGLWWYSHNFFFKCGWGTESSWGEERSSTIHDTSLWSLCLKSYLSHPSRHHLFVLEGKFSVAGKDNI